MDTAKKHCKTKEYVDKNCENTQKETEFDSELLPGLPYHIAHICLSTVKPSLLYNVCMSWRNLIYSPSFPPFFSLYTLVCQKSLSETQQNSVGFFSFDPMSSTWRSLPSPPSDPPLCLLRRHPSFISRILPIQSLNVSGRLVLLAATTHNLLPALTHPLIFDPSSSRWYFGPPLSTPRRWCVAGSIDGVIYMGSGTGAKYQSDVARSFERWDTSQKENWCWEQQAPLRNRRFSREAVEALGYRGKLFMVNVKGKAAKDGAVYDVLTNRWEEMPCGMLAGWNGPAMVSDNVIYVVDQENGSLSKYDTDRDTWEEIVQPSDLLKGVEHLSAGPGKICVILADGMRIAVVDVWKRPVKIWTVNLPQGMEAIAAHVLPRMALHHTDHQ